MVLDFGVWAFAITTAKYGKKMAPAKQSHISQPSTKIADTMQTTRIVMAMRYLTMRAFRSESGDWPTVVMLWGFSKETFLL
jgi:hypothetical protein